MISTPETRERAKVIYDYLVAHPEEHSQRHYGKETACGTTMCIAGNAIIAFRPELVQWDHLGNGIRVLKGWFDTEGDIDEIAGELLGLDREEQFDLFYDMDNKRALEKLGRVVEGEAFDDLNVSGCDCGCEDI